MKRRFFFILFLILSWAVTAVADPDSTFSVLDQIKTRYGSLPGMTFPYEREIISQSMLMMNVQSTGDQARGRMYFKPPHFLKIEQIKPKKEVIVSDGAVLWWYIPDKKQAYRYPADQLGKELRLLNQIFQGLKDTQDHFELKETGPEAGNDLYSLQLRPRPPWPDIDSIRLEAMKTGQIKKIEILNIAGGLTRFSLGEIVAKTSFKKDFFSFSAPPGVQVVEETPQ